MVHNILEYNILTLKFWIKELKYKMIFKKSIEIPPQNRTFLNVYFYVGSQYLLKKSINIQSIEYLWLIIFSRQHALVVISKTEVFYLGFVTLGCYLYDDITQSFHPKSHPNGRRARTTLTKVTLKDGRESDVVMSAGF